MRPSTKFATIKQSIIDSDGNINSSREEMMDCIVELSADRVLFESMTRSDLIFCLIVLQRMNYWNVINTMRRAEGWMALIGTDQKEYTITTPRLIEAYSFYEDDETGESGIDSEMIIENGGKNLLIIPCEPLPSYRYILDVFDIVIKPNKEIIKDRTGKLPSDSSWKLFDLERQGYTIHRSKQITRSPGKDLPSQHEADHILKMVM